LGLTKIIAEEYQNLTMKEIQEFGKNMQESANNLYDLLENLLEWSRMQRGVTEFNPEICMLSYLVKQNIDIAKEFAKQKDIQMINNLQEGSQVIADIPMLNTILRNIISNAVKFTSRGGIIEIGTTFLPSDNIKPSDGSVVMYVKDSGIGMSTDRLSKLFKVDQKVSRPGTEGEPSTGLGLLLCKDFIEMHGGRIWVVSEEGKGSTFYFTLV
jgi:signal transduction histidine kinase